MEGVDVHKHKHVCHYEMCLAALYWSDASFVQCVPLTLKELEFLVVDEASNSYLLM